MVVFGGVYGGLRSRTLRRQPPLALASGQFSPQGIQSRTPELLERTEPVAGLPGALGVHRVESARALGTHGGEAVITKDLQLLRDRRLADPEFGLHLGADLSGAEFAPGQHLEDAAPDGVTQDIESVHELMIASSLI